MGNKRFTNQSETHMVIIQTDNAVPRTWVGNISVEMTNFNGPSERAKNKRNSIIQLSINHPVMFIQKQIPVNESATAAHMEPKRYKGRRPQLSTFIIAINVKSTLATPNITW